MWPWKVKKIAEEEGPGSPFRCTHFAHDALFSDDSALQEMDEMLTFMLQLADC